MIAFAIGFVTALVVIQFYPKAALVGVWVKEKVADVVKNGLF